MRWLGRNRGAVTSNRQFLGERRWKEQERRTFRLKRRWQAKGTKSAKRHLRQLSGKPFRRRKDRDHVLSERIVENTLAEEADRFSCQWRSLLVWRVAVNRPIVPMRDKPQSFSQG